MRTPLLIVVTGMPSSGKTTIAEALSLHLRLPLVTKDEIKERLYDTLGTGDVEWSGRLGRAAYALIFGFAESLLAAGSSAIVEATSSKTRKLSSRVYRITASCRSIARHHLTFSFGAMGAGFDMQGITTTRRSETFATGSRAGRTRPWIYPVS